MSKKTKVKKTEQGAQTSADAAADSPDKAGWTIPEWCSAVTIRRSTFYTLRALAPRSIKLGTRTVIIESPAAWVDRVAKAGGAPRLRAA